MTHAWYCARFYKTYDEGSHTRHVLQERICDTIWSKCEICGKLFSYPLITYYCRLYMWIPFSQRLSHNNKSKDSWAFTHLHSKKTLSPLWCLWICRHSGCVWYVRMFTMRFLCAQKLCLITESYKTRMSLTLLSFSRFSYTWWWGRVWSLQGTV